VEVRHNEGIAIHIGPEPCIVGREVRDEASVGERIGQPFSRERVLSQVPTLYSERKATLTGALTQVPERPGVVEDPGMCGSSFAREPGDPAFDRWRNAPKVRIGKVRSRSR
jgi:hypothetical protein